MSRSSGIPRVRLDSHSPNFLKWKTLSPRRKLPQPPLCASSGSSRLSHTLPSAPAEVREPPVAFQSVPSCSHHAPVLVLQPPAAEIKEKETKHHGKRSSPFKPPKNAPSPLLPPLHSGLEGDEPRGRGVLFPSTCTLIPHPESSPGT